MYIYYSCIMEKVKVHHIQEVGLVCVDTSQIFTLGMLGVVPNQCVIPYTKSAGVKKVCGFPV